MRFFEIEFDNVPRNQDGIDGDCVGDYPKNCYYKFKTNSKQKEPWIISDQIYISKVLSYSEVTEICRANGIEPQRLAIN